MKTQNYLIVVVGPTAIGKTAVGIEIAKKYQAEIISCDSRQFFKEMYLGTAVPNPEELAAIPHHFIQNKSIFEPFSVGDFEVEALEQLDGLFAQNNIQVMVGGSGLYVDAVIKGFDTFPDIDPQVRIQLITDFETLGQDYLKQTLAEKDPIHFQNLLEKNPQTLENPQRMMRYLEVTLGSGQPYSSFLGRRTTVRNFTPIIVGLSGERQEMYDRINRRVDIMMQNGLLEEVKALHPHKDLNALQTVGYRELFDFIDGTCSLEDAVEEIKKNTRRFAKRQMTWFNRTAGVTWFDYTTPLGEFTQHIDKQLNK